MKCSACQAENPPENKFCLQCGKPLAVTEETPPTTQTPPVSPMPKKGFNSKLVIIGIAIGLIILILIGGLFALIKLVRPSGSQLETPSPASPSSGTTLQENPTQTTTPTRLLKYETDSDGDMIPDFVEEATGYDPNKNDCVEAAGCPGISENIKSKKPTNILFILDSSGSMAGNVSGGQKMAIAKEAFKNYVTQTPQEVNIGFMVYGHKGNNTESGKAVSCAGIELLYPLASINKDEFLAKVDSFSPTGWTPIADSLRQAGDQAFLGKEGENNKIVLISDGIETCGGNPCQVAQELKNSGIETVIDVIGFDVDAEAKRQLECIAQVSGGAYFDARSRQEFFDWFDSWEKRTIEYIEAWECLSLNYINYNSCLNKQFIAVNSYLNKRVLEIAGQDQEEINKISEVKDRISKYWREATGESAEGYREQTGQLQ